MSATAKYVIVFCLATSSLLLAWRTDKKMATSPNWPIPRYILVVDSLRFQLGKQLFYDPSLSADGKTSCGSCHKQQYAFSDGGNPVSKGCNGATGLRNTLPLFNLSWNTSFMWDGGINHLEIQPLGPITSHIEMNTSLAQIAITLRQSAAYRQQFILAYGDSAITGQHILQLLASFLSALQSKDSRYDKFINQETGGNLNVQELHGLLLFRQHCSSCHQEPLFTDYSFYDVGLDYSPHPDSGRMAITRQLADSLKFRVPSLRNIAVTAPYMHDGRYRTLMQVLNFYTDSVQKRAGVAAQMCQPLRLSVKDKEDIIAFLGTLTDTAFLTNPKFAAD